MHIPLDHVLFSHSLVNLVVFSGQIYTSALTIGHRLHYERL